MKIILLLLFFVITISARIGDLKVLLYPQYIEKIMEKRNITPQFLINDFLLDVNRYDRYITLYTGIDQILLSNLNENLPDNKKLMISAEYKKDNRIDFVLDSEGRCSDIKVYGKYLKMHKKEITIIMQNIYFGFDEHLPTKVSISVVQIKTIEDEIKNRQKKYNRLKDEFDKKHKRTTYRRCFNDPNVHVCVDCLPANFPNYTKQRTELRHPINGILQSGERPLVEEYLLKQLPTIRFEYYKQLKQTMPEGPATFQLVIGDNGHVQNTKVLKYFTKQKKFEEHLLTIMKKWKFPNLKGDSQTIEFSINFRR